VTVAGRQVHLTGKEYAVLELTVLRKGMVLTKEHSSTTSMAAWMSRR
jgi:DNA-binding response OmpR family regulator